MNSELENKSGIYSCWGNLNHSNQMITYHDREWGEPLKDDLKLFEFLILEGMQAGLSWSTILMKRDAFREALDSFDPEKISRYDYKKIEQLLKNPSIIRNRSKLESVILNAQAFKKISRNFGSFSEYVWSFVESKTIQNNFSEKSFVPSRTKESELISRSLKSEGFKYVGPVICYSFMQATGMVNDHVVRCFRWRQLSEPSK